jgi:hypothetical protein
MHKDVCTLIIMYIGEFFLQREIFQTLVVNKIKHILMSNNVFFFRIS